jgi:hypothetical protein
VAKIKRKVCFPLKNGVAKRPGKIGEVSQPASRPSSFTSLLFALVLNGDLALRGLKTNMKQKRAGRLPPPTTKEQRRENP